MKKALFTMMLAALACVGLVAAQPATEPKVNTQSEFEGWTAFQLGFFPGTPSDTDTVPVVGIKVGAPICTGAPVNGAELSLIMSGSKKVSGLQGSVIITDSEEVNGIQLGIVNFVKNCSGVQLGIFNNCTGKTFQIGILNHVEGGKFPWLPICNFNF